MTRKVDKVNQGEDESLLALIEQATDVVRTVLASADDEDDLPNIESRLFDYVARHEGGMAGDLVKRSGRDKAQVARIVAQLMKRGLIVREVGEDRRSYALHLTTEGRAVHRRLQRKRSRAAATLFERLSAVEREQLATLLAKLTTGGE